MMLLHMEYSGDRRLVANAPHEMTQIHHLQKSAAQLFDLSSDSDTASEVEKSPQLTAIKEPTDSINQQMEESALFDISSEDSKSRPSSSASNTQFAGSANIPLSHQQKAFFKLLQIMTAHDVNASAAELKACIKLDESITHELIEKGLNILRKKSRSSTFNIKLVPTGEHSLTNTDELIRKLQDHEITEKHFILTNVPGIPYILVQRNPQNNQLHVLLSPEYEQLDSFLGDLSKSRQVMLTSMLSSVQIVKVNGMALVTTQSSAEILRRAPSRSRRH